LLFYITQFLQWHFTSGTRGKLIVHSKGGEDKKAACNRQQTIDYRQWGSNFTVPRFFGYHLSFVSCPLPIACYICRMEVNDAMIDKLAHLARLKFNDEEKQEIKTDLQRMIAFVEKMNELDLENVEPLLHMSDEINVLREDTVEGSVSRADALKNAPVHDEQFFKVPKVIKPPSPKGV
jgi:aspartyl-tRNA(Asn)/glutamyl-tRNA(Gln) amidotransferase subunit C